jgi:predicted transcriptional regulator
VYRAAGLELIDKNGRVYVGELKRETGMSCTYLRSVLTKLQREVPLHSWVELSTNNPRGPKRRYYARGGSDTGYPDNRG